MPRTRLTAEERHEQLIGAAVTAFSQGGYAGTTTDQVARLAGVSQPYVIRLFGTKQQLFIAAIGHTCDRIEEHFRAAAARDAPTLEALATSYNGLIAERELITLLLHGFAAAGDPTIGDVIRAGFGRIYATVRELTGADAQQARDFMAMGMLCTVLGSLRLVGPGAVQTEPWMAEMAGTLNLQP
jgi:AcrR family transcriptional regulator